MRLHDLEAALHASWDHVHLAVYGDELQLLGDPRGELIAIDLHIDANGASAALEARRHELLATLLGEVATHPAIRCSYGFIEIVHRAGIAVLDAVLLGSLGPYLRAASFAGDYFEVTAIMKSLGLQPRPWLTRLELRQTTRVAPALSHKLATAVVAAAPRLETLDVVGTRVLPAVAFPSVRRLRVTCSSAVAPLMATWPAPCFPAVTELDFAFGDAESSALLPPVQLPALRRLDVSRVDQPDVDVFRFVRDLAVLPQLTHLRLPSIRIDTQAKNVQAALDRCENLVEVTVTDSYGAFRRLSHRSAKILLP